MNHQSERPFDAIMFDLGGVLVELGGVSRMLDLLNHTITTEELWTRWLTSPTVRQFETGLIDSDQFVNDLRAEFELTIEPEQFIAEFTSWPTGLYPGTRELLLQLAPHYTLACLTNTNALHWPRVCDEMELKPLFAAHFASHLIGLLKPDREVFQHVVHELGYAPERILFLDDNRLNVESARSIGLSAYCVDGLTGATEQLTTLGVLPLP